MTGLSPGVELALQTRSVLSVAHDALGSGKAASRE